MGTKRHTVERVKIELIDFTDSPLKEQDATLFHKLKKCIETQGQLRNVLLLKHGSRYECIEGSKIIHALKELQEEQVDAIIMDFITAWQMNLIKLEVFKD